ncbi:MAG: bacillithiol biosynthesis cysteine-adding enzyme BshC [Bacteroidota bacterium]
MTPPAAVGTSTLPHAALGASALFQAYVASDPEAAGFYRHAPFEAPARAEAARLAAAHAAHRDAVADVLAEQNRAWDADDDTLDLVETLRDPEAVAVVTGQQLGLFAGPLYTVYKALTAVRLADRLGAETGRPVVPVFWLADEDHDFAEIRRAVFSNGPDVRAAAYEDGLDPVANRGMVGRMVLDDEAVRRALTELDAGLPRGAFHAEAAGMAREAYQAGRTMRDAFALLIRQLAPGLVLMSADDARLKRLAAPLFRREIADWTDTFDRLGARSAALEAAGFHAQVQPSPLNLFWVADDGRRLALDPTEAGIAVRGTDTLFTEAELLDRLGAEPERFSPNVVLRPLMQDTLLPTAAYVAGPGEAAYFAQLGPVYEAFGVPMPVIEPRLSLTVVEPGVAKVLDRYALGVPDLRGDLAPLWKRLALAASAHDLGGAFAEARRHLAEVEARLDAVVPEVDATLAQTLGATRARMDNALDRLETKTVRAEKRNHDVVRARLERAAAALWPGGALQERTLSPLQLVALHGPEVIASLVHAVDLDASVHHVVQP